MMSLQAAWTEPPLAARLPSSEVHIWRADLRQSEEIVESILPELSPAEREKAARFASRRDRDRYVCAHGALRRILSSYIGAPASQLEFAQSPQGKPRLIHSENIQFNLSHAEDIALIAVAREAAVGIDVERLRPIAELEDMAERAFTRGEIQELAAVQSAQKTQVFFRLWTRREAWQKCIGEGIAHEIREIPASAFLLTFEPEAGYIAAAASDRALTPRFFRKTDL